MLLLGSAIGLAFGYAGLYFSTLAVFLKPMAASLGWPRAATAAATLMSMLGLAVGAPLQGLLMDRWGARRMIGLSVLVLGGSLCAFSVLPNSTALLGGISFIMGALTVATGPSGYLSVLPRWFDRRLGAALSVAMVGVGVGAIAMPKLAQYLIQTAGWRDAYRALAVLALAGGGTAYLMLGAGETAGGDAARGPVADRQSAAMVGPAVGMPLPAALQDRQFWIIAGAMLVGSAAGLSVIIHLAALLSDRGVSPATAATAVAFSGVGVLIGRLGAGALLDLVYAPLVGALTYVLAAIGAVLVVADFSGSVALVGFGATLVGLAVGAEGDFMAFAVRRYFGMRSFAGIYGCLLGAYALGGVIGPVSFGLAFDRLGGYGQAMSVAIAALLLNAVLVLMLGRYRFGAAPVPL